MEVFGQFLSWVHVRLVAKSRGLFKQEERGDGGGNVAEEEELEDERNPQTRKEWFLDQNQTEVVKNRLQLFGR